jgi:hypothetical protein
MSRRGWVILALVIASPAQAADPRADSLTLHPWTDATVSLAAAERKLSIAYGQLIPTRRFPLLWFARVAAPLDEETRIAAFIDQHRLVSAFHADVQIGYDSRANRLRELRRPLEQLERLSKRLRTMSAYAKGFGLLELARQLGVKGYASHTKIAEAVCAAHRDEGLVCPGDGNARAQAISQWYCNRFVGHPCRAAEELADYATRRCGAAAQMGPEPERCLIARWLLEWMSALVDANGFAATVAALKEHDDQRAREILELYVLWVPDQRPLLDDDVDEKGISPTELVVTHRSEILRAFRDAETDALSGSLLRMRDLNLVGAPSDPEHHYFSVVADLSFAYDLLKAYHDDVALPPIRVFKLDFQAGLSGTIFLAKPSGLSVNVRTGYELWRSPPVRRIDRCVTLPSSDADVTGHACAAAPLYVAGALPGSESSAYLRLAVDYQFVGDPRKTKIIPGLETRLGFEGLGGNSRSLAIRLAAFFTPVTGAAAARAGLGVDFQYAIDGTPDQVVQPGAWTVVPFAFVGATTTALTSD